MIRIYEIPNNLYNEWMDTDDELLDLDEYIRSIGYKSCKYIPHEHNMSGHWELSEEEYTWFILRWS